MVSESIVNVSPLILNVPSDTVKPASDAKFEASVFTLLPEESVIFRVLMEGLFASVCKVALNPSASSFSISDATVSPSATSI